MINKHRGISPKWE